MRRALALAALAAAVVGGACGESDEDEIRGLVGDFYSGRESVCDHMTATFLAGTFGRGADPEARCRAQARRAPEHPRYSIEAVKVSGRTARAAVEADGEAGTFRFVKEGEAWKVDDIIQSSGPAG